MRFHLEALEVRVLLSGDGALPVPSQATDHHTAAERGIPMDRADAGGVTEAMAASRESDFATGDASYERVADPRSLAALEERPASGLGGENSRGEGASRVGLHNVSGIPDLVNPAEATPILLPPGKLSLEVAAAGAGRAGLWKFALPALPAQGAGIPVHFDLKGITQLPTDVAVAWYDEAGNLLAVADDDGAGFSADEESGPVTLEPGRTYLVGAFVNRAVVADALRLEVVVSPASSGTPVAISARTGTVTANFQGLGQVFQSPSDVRWHPLGLLNAGDEVEVTVTPDVVGNEVVAAIFRRVPAAQQVAGSSTGPSYVRVGQAVSSTVNGAEVTLKAPTGATLSEQEYLLVVAPKDYQSAVGGYRVDVQAIAPLVAPAAVSVAETTGAPIFQLRPTATRGIAEAALEDQAVVGTAARFFTFRAAASGPGVIRVDAGFDAVVALYSANRSLVAVATRQVQGVVELDAPLEGGDLYYVRVVNGPTTQPRETNGFGIDLRVATSPGTLVLAAPAEGSVTRDSGGFTIAAQVNAPPSFFEMRPAMGIDVVTILVSPPNNAAIRISVASADGFVERSFPVGMAAVLSLPVTTQGAPLQIAVASSGGHGSLLYYNALTLPRELPIGSLAGRVLSSDDGNAESTTTGFDRSGDRAGFEFYQGLVAPNRTAQWKAVGSGGAMPVLARYEATGSVLKLVDWVVADGSGEAALELPARSERLYGVAAFQVARRDGGAVQIQVDHPASIPVAVGMVPDLAYEAANPNPARFRYILQIRSVTLEKSYEQDYWETLLPDRFYGGGLSDDPAMPLLEIQPDTPGSALKLRVTILDGDGNPLRRWNGEAALPFTAGDDGVIRVDFAALGVLQSALEGKNLRFRVSVVDGALGDGTYTLRMTVRTPNPHPYEVTETRWDYPGGGSIPDAVGAVSSFPPGTSVADVLQDPFGEGSIAGTFTSTAVGVHVYRFWTPSEGPFRVWTEGRGATPANTTIKLYRARYAVTSEGERNSWWETVDYLEELDGVGPSLDWFPADRSEIDAQILIQDPEFPAYKAPTDDLGQSTVGNPLESALETPYLPKDRQFSDVQDVYFVVVKNEQGTTGGYRLHVSTGDLPRLQREPIRLPHRPTAAAMRSVLSVDIAGVETYGNRIGVLEIQMPEKHSGYIGVSAQAGADWRFGLYNEAGEPLTFGTEVDGERRYLVPPGGQVILLKVLETGRNTNSNNRITLAATLLEDAGLPTNLSSLGLGGVAQTLLPTNPWGELEAGAFTGSAAVDSAGKLFRFRVPTGTVRIDVTPVTGSLVSFEWGIYDDGRLLARDLAVPGQPATYTTNLAVGPLEVGSPAGRGRNLVLVVRHASVSVQPAQFGVTIDPEGGNGFGVFDPGRTSVPLPDLAFESAAELRLEDPTLLINGNPGSPDWDPDQWIRFRVPDGPGQTPRLVDLPTSENVYPLRYDVFDAAGKVRVASGTKAFTASPGTIDLPQLEGGKAYVVRLAPRDQPLSENLPVHVSLRTDKAERVNGAYRYSVPASEIDRPVGARVVYPDYRGDFSAATNLDGSSSVWWYHHVPKSGPVTLTGWVEGSTRVRVSIYRPAGSGEFLKATLVDFVNESSVEITPDGKKFVLTTFLGEGEHYIEVARSNSNGGEARIQFHGPEYEIERLTVDPNQGLTLRSQMGRTNATRFFEVIAPAGSMGPATFLAYDLDLLDGRPHIAGRDFTQSPPKDIIAQLYLKARMQVWAVSDNLVVGGGLSSVLIRTLDRDPANTTVPLKATLETLGLATPFQRYVIGIQSEGTAPGYPDEQSGRSKSVGVQAVFQVPVSGTPDLVVESIRLLPNSGQTLVEVAVINRGYAVALTSQSQFSYPTIEAGQPVTALLAESVLGSQTRRIRLLDWVDPASPDDVTRYRVDFGEDIAEVDETNNLGEVAMRTVNAFRPVFSATLSGNLDGNSDPGLWGRYLDSRGHNAVKVLADIVLDANDGDDAANTFDSEDDFYRFRTDSPLLYTTGNHYFNSHKVLERVEISALAPTGPGAPNIFTAYAVDRFGLRSEIVIRVIQVVPFPKWMEAGETEVVFNPDTRKYELNFSARPVDYAATLTQMLDANIPLVGDLQNQFFVEAIAERSFSLDPSVAIPPILPSVRARTTVLGQDVLNKVFQPGTSDGHVSVLGHIDVRADTLEASAFELTTRFDQYPVDHWEGPEIPIFGFDLAIVSAAVQAQVIIDLKFDAAITFAFDLTQTNAPLRITSPSFVGLDLRVELRFEGEVEVAGFLDIASVGGGFFFTLKPRYGLEEMPGSIPLENFLSEACLGLSATIGGELSADIFGFEVFSIEMESDEIQLTNCDVATASLAGATALTGTTLVSAGAGGVSLQGTKPALPNDKFIRYTQRILAGDALLPRPAVRPNPQLILDPSTGDRIATFLDVPVAGSPPVLNAARGTATGFSAPVPLSSSEWMTRPILAATRDGAGLRSVVVYQATPNPTAATTRNGFLAGQDLKYRYFDGTTWSEEIALTDNGVLDWQASMAFNANGDGALVWIQKVAATSLNERGHLSGNDRVLVSSWNKTTHRWGAPVTLATGNAIQNQPSVTVAPDGRITVAWIQWAGSQDRIAMASRPASGSWTVSSLNASTLPADGRFRRVGLEAEPDGRITVVAAFTEAAVKGAPMVTRVVSRTGSLNDLGQTARAFQVLATTGGVSSLQLLRAPDGALVVGWHERRGDFSDAVVIRRQSDGSWTRPVRATQSVGDERAVRLVMDASGAVLSVYERGVHFFPTAGGGALPSDGPDLKLSAGTQGLVGSNFAVRGAELNMVGPLMLGGWPGDGRPFGLAGTEIQAEVTVRNSGGATADAIVTLYRANPLNLGGKGEKVSERKIRLLPGMTLSVEMPVEITLGVNRFTAEVTLAGGNDAFTNRDNQVGGQITGRIDLALENGTIADEVAGQPPQTGVAVGLRYEIVNRSGLTYRGPVRITTYWEDPSKPGVRTVVQSGTAELEWAPGQRRALAGVFNFETAGLRWVGAELGDLNVTELSEANNRVTVPLDLRPDLALKDVTVTRRGEEPETFPALSVRVFNSSGVGNAEVLALVSNVGGAPVRSFTLRLFHSVDGGPFANVQEQVVTGLLKPGEYGQARFKVAALAGVNVYRAEVVVALEDLPVGLREPRTMDNVASTAVVLQGLPDLQVGAVTFSTPAGNPPALRIGGTARVDVRVDNKGIAAARGVLVEIFARTPRQAGEGILLGSATLTSVDALGSETVRITLNTSVLPEDADAIRVVVDRHQDILELSDLNNIGGRAITVAPPAFYATQAVLNGGIGQLSQVGSLGFVFNRDFAVPRDPGVLRIQNLTTGEFVDPTKYVVSVDAATRTATWRFTGLPGGVLPAGEYVAQLAVGAISDRASNSLGRAMVLRFAVTPGDANGDGVTNERDFLLVWRELRKTEATRSLRADMDGDGKVTSADLTLVRGNYGGRGAGKGIQP